MKNCLISREMFASSTQLQNWSFHVVVRMTTAVNCIKAKASSRACKTDVFRCLICKFVPFLLRAS